jgi:hypothetical protein
MEQEELEEEEEEEKNYINALPTLLYPISESCH